MIVSFDVRVLLLVLAIIDLRLIFPYVRFFPSRQMIARRIMSMKKTSPYIERRACIKFESVGMKTWEGDNGGISTDGVLIAAPFAVERAG